MSIEGLPPASNPFSRMEKAEEPKQKPKVNEQPVVRESVPGKKSVVKPAAQQAEQAKTVKPGEPELQTTQVQKDMAEHKEIGEKVSRHIAELQALTEKIRRNQQNMQTRNEIASMGHSIVEMRQDLSNANNERFGNNIDVEATYTKMSYWEKLDVMAKSQTINKIKEQIKETVIDRAQLVSSLKEQVSAGTYKTSGSAILAGMIDEYF